MEFSACKNQQFHTSDDLLLYNKIFEMLDPSKVGFNESTKYLYITL